MDNRLIDKIAKYGLAISSGIGVIMFSSAIVCVLFHKSRYVLYCLFAGIVALGIGLIVFFITYTIKKIFQREGASCII